jgi:hypothetical protein
MTKMAKPRGHRPQRNLRYVLAYFFIDENIFIDETYDFHKTKITLLMLI